LDKSQSEAVLQVPDGVQRIRGLAGSGKTVVLALKAAYLHASNPEWKIAVTFNVRSLKQQFTNLIQEFFIAETGESPDWTKIQVINSWGSPASVSNTGIYAEYCKANQLSYQDFRTAQNQFGGQAAFDEICKLALSSVQAPTPVYDAILVDEAQDFAPSFLRICYQLLDKHKRLVYAYDELQSLSSQGMPSSQEIFGVDAEGKPLVSFENNQVSASRRDILLERCYRNSRPILSTAHAFGFGIYRDVPLKASTGLVQMFDQTSLWNEIGYEVSAGHLADNEVVKLRRTENTSPLFLESHSDLDDLISVQNFQTMDDQYAWIAEQIRTNLQEDELQPNDIMVINPDPISARKNFGPLRNRLLDLGIDTHLAGVDTSSDTFFSNDARSITCTGIYRAKGNEAGMVYVINAHEGQTQTYNLSTVRNRLFVAITRSKAWVRVTGVSPHMGILAEEFDRIKRQEFALKFRYPTPSEREKLRIVHRELTGRQHNEVKSSEKSARDLLERLRAGGVHAQDLDAGVREQLLELLRDTDDQ
jgi:superfamily I DNA and RNA helicase